MKRPVPVRVLAPLFIFCLASGFALAGDWKLFKIHPIPDNGKVAYPPPLPDGKKKFESRIQWSGTGGIALGTTTPASGGGNVDVPKESPDSTGKNRTVTDYQLQDREVALSGESSNLHAAAFADAGGGDFIEYPFVDYVGFAYGEDRPLFVPSIFADTNGDGSLAADDLLYSAVNFVPFIAAGLNVQIGDVVTIVNGRSAMLPGFLFGTAPIVRDLTNPEGLSNPSPFTGAGIAETGAFIIASPAPEPSTLSLGAGLGLFVLAAWTRRRRPRRQSVVGVDTLPGEFAAGFNRYRYKGLHRNHCPN